MEGKKGFSRREFLDASAKGATGLLMLPHAPRLFAQKAKTDLVKSRVVVVKDDNALTGSKFNQNVAEAMMDAGIKNLTKIQDVGEAWKSLFPGVSPSSVIAIKINAQFSAMSTHPPVVYALLASLKKMAVDGNPFPENNIIVWDNKSSHLSAAGYKINTSTTGVRCFGTEGNYDSTLYPIDDGFNQRLSKILTDQCDYLINFSVLKNHIIAGVSLSLKNHYGSIHGIGSNFNPDDPLHTNAAALQIASLNALKSIRDKQVVCICDAIKGTISGGPDGAPQVASKSLIFSQDPVAHDYIGTLILKENGCSDTDTDIAQKARHIAAAANQYGLGTCDPNQIDQIAVNNPSTSVFGYQADRKPDNPLLSQNYPNPFNSQTRISYQLPEASFVRIRVANIGGRSVRRLFEGRQGPGYYHVGWDGCGDDGSRVPSGTYLCILESGRLRSSIKMQLVQ